MAEEGNWSDVWLFILCDRDNHNSHTSKSAEGGGGSERLLACPECHDVDSSLQSQPLICFKAPSDYQCVWLLSVVSVCS